MIDYRSGGLNIVRTASRLVETRHLRAMVEHGRYRILDGSL